MEPLAVMCTVTEAPSGCHASV